MEAAGIGFSHHGVPSLSNTATVLPSSLQDFDASGSEILVLKVPLSSSGWDEGLA
jgi:hypothetical protein